MASLQGLVGAQSNSSAATPVVRLGKTSEVLVSQVYPQYGDLVSRGLVFSAGIPAGTGQAPGTAIGTTAAFTLANGSTSTVDLHVLKTTAGYVSGTLGAGVLLYLAHFSAGSSITAPSGGTAITPTNMLLGSSAASAANCRFNNTVPASGLGIRALASLGASLASTAVQPWHIWDDVDGAIVIGPGQAISIQGVAAAGTSPLIVVTMTWAEVPRQI